MRTRWESQELARQIEGSRHRPIPNLKSLTGAGFWGPKINFESKKCKTIPSLGTWVPGYPGTRVPRVPLVLQVTTPETPDHREIP
eukprot:1913751-Rhodomonas_salina.1